MAASTDIRNIALVGHKGSGKTSTAEAMLYTAGATTRLNRVDDGNSLLDFDPEEQKRVASLSASLCSVTWQGRKLNVLDTPGDGNFFADTQNCIAVCEGIVSLVGAPDGVEPQTKRTFDMAASRNMARIIFISKMDRERADFDKCVAQIKAQLAAAATPVVIPIGAEDSFSGVVDLIQMKTLSYPKDGKGEPTVSDIPAELRERAAAEREKLIEEIASSDEALMEKYLESGELEEVEMAAGLATAVKAGLLVPILAGSGVHNMGVSRLLDLCAQLMPSPLEGPEQAALDKDGNPTTIARAPDAPFNGIVFKTIVDQHAGKISIFRVLAGKATSDSSCYNVGKRDNSERFGSLLTLTGKKTEQCAEAPMGDIAAVAKLKDTDTGDTLASVKGAQQYILPLIPPTLISYILRPKNKGDEEKIGQAIRRLQDEDPALVFGHDEITSELTLSGCGVAHVEVSLEKVKRRFGIEVELAPINVPYRETITKAVSNVEGKHKKQTGGRGQFGVAYLNVLPNPGQGYEYVDKIVGGSIPRQYIPAVDKGIQASLLRGVIAGYPTVDVKVECIDGKYHDVDSYEMSFQVAGSKGIKAALEKAGPVVLEPIMEIEVMIPEESLGDIMGDLNSRRGRIQGMDTTAGLSTIKAQIPMAEVLMYAPDLHSMTAGRGSFTMRLDHYEQVPSQLVSRVVADSPVKQKGGDDE